MLTYPSIPKQITDIPYYLFDKLDGSNIRADFSLKKGLHRYGTRNRLLSDDSGPILNKAPALIKPYEVILGEIFKKNKWEQGTLFFEFYGENSFAGNHFEGDEFKVVVIDASIYRKGFLSPKDYLDAFANKIPTPRFFGVSKLNQDVVRSVNHRTLEGMTFEGIVAKAFVKNQVERTKVKSFDWIQKLKGVCGDDINLFNKLA